MPKPLILAAAAAVLLLAPSAPAIETEGAGLTRVGTGFSRPVFATARPGEPSRLFVVEQHAARVRILDLDTGGVAPVPFLVVPGGVSTGNEQGLLGLAFHPDFASNGLVYVNLTSPQGHTEIRRYQAPPANRDQVDADSETLLLRINQPQSNHNGGWIGFGPDGLLTIASGDGGGGNDDDAGHTLGSGNGQDITNNLLGKLLRIDVDRDDFPQDADRNYGIPPSNPFVGVTGDDEIWAYGLRNPWRASFDRETGDLWIGDVGQNAREEIDFQLQASSGGENYGWRLREGTIATPGGVGGPPPADAIEPVYDYLHGFGPFQGNSVTGGYRYRGPSPGLRGLYFFGDAVFGRVWSLQLDQSLQSFDVTQWDEDLVPDAGSLGSVVSFAEDGLGNLYILDLDGDIFRLERPDRDADGIPNASDNCVEIANPGQEDFNAGSDDDSSLPGVQHYGDPCDADLDEDGFVGASDFLGVFRPCFGADVLAQPACAEADFDGDGVIGAADFFGVLRPSLGRAPGPGVTEP